MAPFKKRKHVELEVGVTRTIKKKFKRKLEVMKERRAEIMKNKHTGPPGVHGVPGCSHTSFRTEFKMSDLEIPVRNLYTSVINRGKVIANTANLPSAQIDVNALLDPAEYLNQMANLVLDDPEEAQAPTASCSGNPEERRQPTANSFLDGPEETSEPTASSLDDPTEAVQSTDGCLENGAIEEEGACFSRKPSTRRVHFAEDITVITSDTEL